MPQSLAKVYLHATFSTKNRFPALADNWREDLFRVIGGSINDAGCQAMLVGGVADHLHVLFQLSRTVTIAEVIGRMKSNSSAWIQQTEKLPGRFEWQAGYAAFSVSQSNIDRVRDYIKRQPERHARQSFQDELRELLRRYEVEWDEQHIWD